MKEPPNYRYVELPECCYTCECGPVGECFITFECKLHDWPFANPNGLCDDWKGHKKEESTTLKEAALFKTETPLLDFEELGDKKE